MNEQQQVPSIPVQRSIELTPEEIEENRRLDNIFDEIEKGQLGFLDESGKSIIEHIATLLAVLFAVSAFGHDFPPPYLKGNLPAKSMVIVTMVLYLAALGTGLWAIQPRSYKRYKHNVTRTRAELAKMMKRKMLWIRVAGSLFALGSIALAVLIFFIIRAA
jgi:hypothetical protein